MAPRRPPRALRGPLSNHIASASCALIDGRPSAAPAVSGAETAPVAEPLGADPFSPPCEDLSGEDWSESRGSEPSHEREAAGFDALASLQNSFAQSRIDFNDPYRDEEIESVAHALERITVRNRFC